MPGSKLSPEEISFVEKTIANAGDNTVRDTTLDAIQRFENGDVDVLVGLLGIAHLDAYRPLGEVLYHLDGNEGRRTWDNYRKQLRDVICGDSDTYKDERAKVKSSTENALIVLIPLVLSALNISPYASGIAVVLSLIILKIGLNTFCETAGDLQKLRGKPGQICSATGRYMNLREGRTEVVYKGARFPDAPEFSQWVFYEEVAEE